MGKDTSREKASIEEGSVVLLSDGKGRRYLLDASAGMQKVPDLGVVDGSRLVGSGYGSPYTVGRFTGYLLRPTVRDLAELLRGKAQTILPKDSAVLIMNCGIRPGSKVLEVGAGSGALTTALCEAVGPEGLVVSYERREDMARAASDNLRRFALQDRWRLVGADAACGIDGDDFDAALVDVPEPWTIARAVWNALTGGGSMAIYVPTTNQLEKGMAAMRELGMIETEAVEVLVRAMEVGPGGVRPSHHMLSHTAYLAFARKVR